MNSIFLFVCGMSSLFIWTIANSFITLLIFILVYGFMSGSVFSLSEYTLASLPIFIFFLKKKVASITAAITGMEKYPSGVCLYLFFMTASRFGPSLAGAVQNATDKNSFFPQELFTGISFVLSALITLILKYKMNPKIWAKI